MSDSISEEHSDELDGTQDDLTIATFTFTYKTFLFGGTKQAQLIHPKILSSYTSSFISSRVEELFPDEIDAWQKTHPN